MLVNGLLQRYIVLFLIVGAYLFGGCAAPSAEGEVRYRGKKTHVLVVTTDPGDVVSGRRAPVLGRVTDRAGGTPDRPQEVHAVIDAEALGRLVGDLEAEGFFDLPGTTVAPDPFPPFALEVQVEVDGEARRHCVLLKALQRQADADAFALAAGAVVRAAGR